MFRHVLWEMKMGKMWEMYFLRDIERKKVICDDRHLRKIVKNMHTSTYKHPQDAK